MEHDEIIEGNKLIAEFKGVKNNNNEDCLYHISWDCLMLVVDKINNIEYKTIKGVHENDIYAQQSKVMQTFISTSMERMWTKVVVFIKWYNSVTVNNKNNGK